MNRPTLRSFRDYFLTIGVAVVIASLIRTYVIEAYRIPNFAMKPTLLAGDTIFVWKASYLLASRPSLPKRGEVVVFSGNPPDGALSLDYIRRVIGLPGDQVGLKDGQVILNGKILLEKPLLNSTCEDEQLPDGKTYPVCLEKPFPQDMPPQIVPNDQVWVVGDLRSKSDAKKNKNWAMVSMSQLKGTAWVIWLSIDYSSYSKDQSSWIPKLRWDRLFQQVR